MPTLAYWAVLDLLAGSVVAVNIETVPVGNPGNPADPNGPVPGNGRVDYVYNIGKYEVTASQYTAFLNAVAGVDTYELYSTNMTRIDGCGITRSGGGTAADPYTYTVAPAYVNRPVNCVSWGDAARFVNWLQNGQTTGAQGLSTTEDGAYYLNGATSRSALLAVTRKADWKWAIPTEYEWYKAAYHKNDGVTAHYWTYPTGSHDLPGEDLNDTSGNNANFHYDGPYPIQAPYYTTVVGQFKNSESPYGTFDQGGNVAEWNEAILGGDARGVRGGSFGDSDGPLQSGVRGSNFPTTQFSEIGFRVVAVPDPATLSLLALAGAGRLQRRRRARD